MAFIIKYAWFNPHGGTWVPPIYLSLCKTEVVKHSRAENHSILNPKESK